MSLDSVQPSLSNQAVHPGQDAHDDRKPDSREERKPKHSARERHNTADPHPTVNILGQVIGQAIDITA